MTLLLLWVLSATITLLVFLALNTKREYLLKYAIISLICPTLWAVLLLEGRVVVDETNGIISRAASEITSRVIKKKDIT
jgi:hypothetical protein